MSCEHSLEKDELRQTYMLQVDNIKNIYSSSAFLTQLVMGFILSPVVSFPSWNIILHSLVILLSKENATED